MLDATVDCQLFEPRRSATREAETSGRRFHSCHERREVLFRMRAPERANFLGEATDGFALLSDGSVATQTFRDLAPAAGS